MDPKHANASADDASPVTTPLNDAGDTPQPVDGSPEPPSLRSLFPLLFAGSPKPLKLRVQLDIQQRAPGTFTRQQLTQLLRRHTGHHAYLSALARHDSRRFDLDGNDAGAVSDEHRKAAADELARRRAAHRERQAIADDQRRNRVTLLRDFERTTLTPANFAALKSLDVAELESLLVIAREEAQQQYVPPPRQERSRRAPTDERRPPRGKQPQADGQREARSRAPGPRTPQTAPARVTAAADTESPEG